MSLDYKDLTVKQATDFIASTTINVESASVQTMKPSLLGHAECVGNRSESRTGWLSGVVLHNIFSSSFNVEAEKLMADALECYIEEGCDFTKAYKRLRSTYPALPNY